MLSHVAVSVYPVCSITPVTKTHISGICVVLRHELMNAHVYYLSPRMCIVHVITPTKTYVYKH